MFKDFGGFIQSTTGQIIVITAIVLLFGCILVFGKSKEEKGYDIKSLTICAILVAIAVVLSQFKLFTMPQGGSVTPLSMLPIALCGYLLGTRNAVMAGIVLGLVNLLIGGYVIHPVQMLIDYPMAFGAMGIGAFMRNRKHGLIWVYIIGIVGRYICAVLSGIIFFGSYAPEGLNSVVWSLWYNFTYIAAEGVITIAILVAIEKPLMQLKDRI